MLNVRGTLFLLRKGRSLHTLSHEPASDSLKRKVAKFEKKRKTRNPKKTEVFVEVPESRSFLDTATTPMLLTAVGVALFAKLLMMEDIRDWGIDVLMDAVTRVEESVRHNSR